MVIRAGIEGFPLPCQGYHVADSDFIIKPFDEKFLLSCINYVILNRQLYQKEMVQLALQVFFAGKKYTITSDRSQILNLLLSTYEAAIKKNLELVKVHDE